MYTISWRGTTLQDPSLSAPGGQNGQLVFIVSIQSSVLIINVQCNALASDDRDLWRSCSNVPRPCLTIPRRRPIYLPELSNTVDENLFATGDTSYHGHNDVSAARIFLPIALWIELWTTKFRNTQVACKYVARRSLSERRK